MRDSFLRMVSLFVGLSPWVRIIEHWKESGGLHIRVGLTIGGGDGDTENTVDGVELYIFIRSEVAD